MTNKFKAGIRRGIRDYRSGRVTPLSEVKRKLGIK